MLKLGTQTGSLVNHAYSGTEKVMPKVGDPATILLWTDRNAATVTETFKKGKYEYFVVQQDHAKRIDKNGFSEAQKYVYTPNPNGRQLMFRVKNGAYESVYLNENGRIVKAGFGNVMIGRREEYWDPCF